MNSVYEHCPGPRIDDAIPLTEETLGELIAKDPENSDFHFALANLLLSNGKFALSIPEYQLVLAKKPQTAAARCNLGIAYFGCGKFDLAISELSQVLLQNAQLTLAPLYLARAHEAIGALEAARSWFTKARELDPTLTAAVAGLANLSETAGDERAASELYAELRTLEPDSLVAEVKLGDAYFLRGKSAFDSSDYDEAFVQWGEGHKRYPRAFSAEQGTANYLRKMQAEFQSQKKVNSARKRFLAISNEHAADAPEVKRESYTLFSRLFFELGLMPEFYERYAELSDRELWWKGECEKGGVYPYAHVRLAAIYSYQGRFAEALESFTFASDHMPAGKSRSLKLTDALRFVRDLTRSQAVAKRSVSEAAPDAWESAGFTDPFGRRAWQDTGLEPADAASWKAADFTAQQTSKWLDEDVSLENASMWSKAGFAEPKTVARWVRGGFSPQEAKLWSEHFEEGVAKALQCKQAGFSDAKTALAWLEVFSVPFAAAPWYEFGFTPQEAAAWIKAGVSDPFAAKQQRETDEAIFAEAALAAQRAEDDSKGIALVDFAIILPLLLVLFGGLIDLGLGLMTYYEFVNVAREAAALASHIDGSKIGSSCSTTTDFVSSAQIFGSPGGIGCSDSRHLAAHDRVNTLAVVTHRRMRKVHVVTLVNAAPPGELLPQVQLLLRVDYHAFMLFGSLTIPLDIQVTAPKYVTGTDFDVTVSDQNQLKKIFGYAGPCPGGPTSFMLSSGILANLAKVKCDA